jgi:hypothetical protein
LRPRLLAADVCVVVIATVTNVVWDAAAQAVVVHGHDQRGASITVERAHQSIAPGATAALAALAVSGLLGGLHGGVRVVVGDEAESFDGADGVAGWPWFRIRATGSRRFPVDARFATVRVTAKWGWSAVPDDVQLATKLQAALLLKRREAPNGLLEFAGDGASLRVSPIDGHVMRLLQPYVTTSRMIV